jgi:DegV family protein with EDD domain
MRIVTNPGSNLPAAAVARYDIHIVPQRIVVDGTPRDTREAPTHAEVDAWVRGAKEHPYVLGTSAAEFLEVFRKAARQDRELIVLQTSRKIIGSYTAGVSAARTFASADAHERLVVEMIDTESTDLGAGLCTILVGESARAGRTLEQTAALVKRFAGQGRLMLTLETLDNLVKGGRASFLRAWLANMLNMTPLISFVDGELAAVGRTSRSADREAALVDALVTKLGGPRRVWLGIAHGSNPEGAARVLSGLQSKLDVAFAVVRPISASIYLHVGRGAIGAYAYPVDDLPWTPPVPAPL